MTWSEVCADPSLQDLPYKIELNEFGDIVMSPASNEHAIRQVDIGSLLKLLVSDGKVLSECSIATPLGVKVADVAWISQNYIDQHKILTPLPVAPDICVEIASPSNSIPALNAKRELYFSCGAKEVWICDAQGKMRFFTPSQEIGQSSLVAGFPASI